MKNKKAIILIDDNPLFFMVGREGIEPSTY